MDLSVKDYATKLKLSYIKRNSDDIIKEAKINEPDYEDFLKKNPHLQRGDIKYRINRIFLT